MYEQFLAADVVIADISTSNVNAFYESVSRRYRSDYEHPNGTSECSYWEDEFLTACALLGSVRRTAPKDPYAGKGVNPSVWMAETTERQQAALKKLLEARERAHREEISTK